MSGILDALGSLLEGGMTNSTAGRCRHSLGARGVGGTGGILADIFGGSTPASTPTQAKSAATASGSLGSGLRSILSDKNLQNIGGLGALAGAVLGGGGKSVKGA